jgi:hypothetical protein
MAPSNKQILQGKDPRFIHLSIEQISITLSTYKWIDNGNYFPMSTPAVKEPALSLLQLLKPILVVETGKKSLLSRKKM